MGNVVGMGLRLKRLRELVRAAPAQPVGQRGKAFGSRFGDVAAGFFRAKTFYVLPDAAQQGQLFRLGQLGHGNAEGFGWVAGELCVDANRQAVTHHQQRRVAERQAVAEQLLEGGIQVFAGGLVLPRKSAALKTSA